MASSEGNSGGNSGLIPQAHGGALLPGGVPGPRGGTGRPRSKIRELSALEYERRIPLLGDIADDEAERASDRIRAVDILGRHGGLHAKGLDRDMVVVLLAQLAEVVKAEAPEASDRIFDTWRRVVREHLQAD